MTDKRITPAAVAQAVGGRGLKINLDLPGKLKPAQVKRLWARAKKRAARRRQREAA